MTKDSYEWLDKKFAWLEKAREQIEAETKDLTLEQRLAYWKEKDEGFRNERKAKRALQKKFKRKPLETG